MTQLSTIDALVAREAIRDAMARYARAVDREDWAGVEAAYHPDAYDDHGGYKGNLSGLIPYLQNLLATAENGMHFLGNCIIDFASPDLALVETYFVSQRRRVPQLDQDSDSGPNDQLIRMGWGRHVDRFERRQGEWRVAHRVLAMDAIYTHVARGGVRGGAATWGTRDGSDPLFELHANLFGQ